MAANTAKWQAYFEARDAGHGVAQAAKIAGIDRTTAYRWERGERASSGNAAAVALGRAPNPKSVPEAVASQALDDFALFRLRYLGRKSTPWQERAAYKVLEAVNDPDRSWLVINMPPGSGKSTLFTHDIPVWLIARDRSIRIQIGSRTERQGRMYVGRIKRSLERTHPLRADRDAVDQGRAFDAQACLQDDYGPFQPEGRTDLWRNEALVVRQPDGQALDDKEPTVSAWGQDSGFLGGRFDLVIWDDLVDKRNTKTDDALANLKEWYSTEAETRLEPGGALILQGQRIAADDLYRYALDIANPDGGRKYQHITYPAHHDEMCEGEHGPDAEPWPGGCLLDPYRLPWRDLERIRDSEPRTWNLMYQQNDAFTLGGLVDPAWLTGGTDKDGAWAPGCHDADRAAATLPHHLADAYQFITVDPSPSEYWGIIWWAYTPDDGRLHAIELLRTRLTPEEFLHYDIDTARFSGLINDWHLRSRALGAGIDAIVVEVNAAQRWLLSQPHVQRWQALTQVNFLPHQTNINKNNPEYGVESLGAWFKHGKVRIPWATPSSRAQAHDLENELLKYPTGKTTDMLMSTWFATLHVNTSYAHRQQGRFRSTGISETARRGLRLASA